MRKSASISILCGLLLVVGCSPNTSVDNSCRGDFIDSGETVCLDLSSANLSAPDAEAFRSIASASFTRINGVLPVDDLKITVIGNATETTPEIGLGGFNPSDDEVIIYVDPARSDNETIFESNLALLLAHEIHHSLRRRTVGYGSTLLEAATSEGMADHFSIEIEGGDPAPWSNALPDSTKLLWKTELLSNGSGAYDHAEWFFGSTASIPRWTGYTVGFELVADYLTANPTATASGLIDTPASIIVGQ